MLAWEDIAHSEDFQVSVGWNADRTRAYLDIEVGKQPEGSIYTEDNPDGITGDGSLSGLRACWRVIEDWLNSVPEGVIVCAVGGDERRHRAYRWLQRKGFCELWERAPADVGGYIEKMYVKCITHKL